MQRSDHHDGTIRAGPARRSIGPAGATRLLCDEMLQRLGRWLRSAGYDTAIAADSMNDRRLVEWAIEDERVLVTRDRQLASRRTPAARILTLSADGLDAAARELRERLGIDWLKAPFTRCLVDNQPLDEATLCALGRLPPAARSLGGRVMTCPRCGRVFWPGSHVRRMRARLERWQHGAGDPAP